MVVVSFFVLALAGHDRDGAVGFEQDVLADRSRHNGHARPGGEHDELGVCLAGWSPAVLAGVLITRGVLGIPVLAPKTANNFGNSATAVYALLAAGATLLATALLHLLLLGEDEERGHDRPEADHADGRSSTPRAPACTWTW
jgi:hypothetical protein